MRKLSFSIEAIDLTLSVASWQASWLIARVAIPWLMMTDLSNLYKAPKWMTTPIQIGSQSPSMLVQVKISHHFWWLSRLIKSIDFRANKPSDVVSTLVSIYDSKDLFVKELQVLLAQRLLAVTDGNYEKEVCLMIFPDLIVYNVIEDSVGIWRFSKFGLEKLRCRFAR
jgi:hypothetical protein